MLDEGRKRKAAGTHVKPGHRHCHFPSTPREEARGTSEVGDPLVQVLQERAQYREEERRRPLSPPPKKRTRQRRWDQKPTSTKNRSIGGATLFRAMPGPGRESRRRPKTLAPHGAGTWKSPKLRSQQCLCERLSEKTSTLRGNQMAVPGDPRKPASDLPCNKFCCE